MPVRRTAAIRLHPGPGAGTLLPIAIGWMMCQGQHPPPTPPSCLSEKTAIPSPRRQRPLYQGSHASAGRLRSASGRHDRSPPVVRHPATPYVRKRCAATAGRGPDGCRGNHAVLGRSVAPGEGTASRFFERHEGGVTGQNSAEAQTHLIAIRRSRPGTERRCIGASDGNTRRPRNACHSARKPSPGRCAVDPSVVPRALGTSGLREALPQDDHLDEGLRRVGGSLSSAPAPGRGPRRGARPAPAPRGGGRGPRRR